MTDRRPEPRAAAPATRRLWLVLVLLVGILGMHGLASDHASTAAAMPLPAAATLDAPGMQEIAGRVGMDGTVGRSMAAAMDSHDLSLVTIDEPHAHSPMSMAGLCLAVLAALLLLTAVRQHERTAPSGGPLPSHLLARLRALPPSRPPDLVAGLCVSRT